MAKTQTHVIRALRRGLQVLEAVNDHNGALVSEIAQATGLPRTTTFRLLENLRQAGFVDRSPRNAGYFVTIRTLHLSHAFAADAWITDTVQPVLEALSRRLLWPIYALTLFGTSMLIRATTTYASPLAIDALPPGTLVPLLTSGAGKVQLAFCSEEERRALLTILRTSTDPTHAPARSTAEFEQTLAQVRRQGYALDVKARTKRNPGRTTSIAVPVLVGRRSHAALSLRYSDAAMPVERAVKRFVPILRKAAREISAGLSRRPPT
ncbi:MAG: IclR family transcriptional regulator C-terminal domain-containing protein [Gammaproteobacteria bacterium]